MRKIFVCGSINLDYVLVVDEHPNPGETVIASSAVTLPGGKGANQAVAAARLGADVVMCGCVGTDRAGRVLLDNLAQNGVDASLVREVEGLSGAAYVTVSNSGENSIVITGGANAELSVNDVDRMAQQMNRDDVLVMQLEVPVEVVAYAAKSAKARGATVVLNAAPALDVRHLLPYIDVLVVNEHEAKELFSLDVASIEAAGAAGEALSRRHDLDLVLTLGDKGALTATASRAVHVAGTPVEVVDTTGAGDTFVGALASQLVSDIDLESAVGFASAAASVACTTLGAQASMPTLVDVLTQQANN